MCDCVNKVKGKLKEAGQFQEIDAPIDYCSGRVFLNFLAKTKDGKEVDVPLLLSKCPWCGKKYPSVGQ